MAIDGNDPTPFPEVNALLQELLGSIKRVLGSSLVGMYLEGSLANGDFDQASDIDFVVVTDEDISDDSFATLKAMHARIATIDSPWAVQLEGSYVSRNALRRHDPERALTPNIERGIGELLKMAYHDESWIIHRYLLRERGITLTGPDPEELIDPISPDDLRRAMLPTLDGWAAELLNDPDEITRRGYPSSYIVLTLCRILYTLQFGDVVSKPKAARWARETVSKKWQALIDSACVERSQSAPPALHVENMVPTLEFIRYTLERSRQSKYFG